MSNSKIFSGPLLGESDGESAHGLSSLRRLPKERPRCDTLDRLLSYAVDFARESFERWGHVEMTLLWAGKDGTVLFALAHGYHSDNKDSFAGVMRQVLEDQAAERYALITEVWTSPDALDCAPSSHPERREAVCVYAEDEKDARAAVMWIERPLHEHPHVSLPEFSNGPPNGRFSRLLKQTNKKPIEGASP